MYAFIASGSVEYDPETASVDIDEMIEALQMAKEEGATRVAGLSGNHRGAKYVRLSTDIEVDED